MARTKKEAVAKEVKQVAEETAEVKKVESTEKEEVKADIPEYVEKLMKLYPQYEKLYITPQGFVHPENAPKYVLENATLYTNKYFNNK